MKKILLHTLLLLFANSLTAQSYPLISSYLGEHTWDRVGYWLSPAGDVNGDGYDDLLCGQNHFSFTGTQSYDQGSAYLILGRPTGDWQLNRSLNKADANFVGLKWDAAGFTTKGVGDVDNDGLDDFIVGNADGKPDHAGDNHAHLYFGRKNADWGKTVMIRTYTDVTLNGEFAHDRFGECIAKLGDINNDGYDDFLLAARRNSEWADAGGKIYLFLGRPRANWSSQISANSADAVFYCDEDFRQAGASLAGLGDVNGDSIPDFIIGSFRIKRPDFPSFYGKAYLFFGKQDLGWSKPFNLKNADAVFFIEGRTSHAVGFVTPAGDVNGDGLNDILLSGYRYSSERGKVYVVFGRKVWDRQEYSLAVDADASWIGEAAGDRIGGYMCNLSGHGDINGDGFDDILIGAPHNDENGTSAGKVYAVYGRSSGWQKNVNLSSIGTTFLGESADDALGDGVSICGDINNDGVDDFFLSAPHNEQAMEEAGKIYIYLGQQSEFQISGHVTFEGSGDPALSVQIDLNSATSSSTQTDGTGFYTFTTPSQTCTITPSHSGPVTNYVTAYDAALIAMHSVELIDLSSLQELAGDVNQDGVVDIMDAMYISRYTIGLGDAGSIAGQWSFTPSSHSYPGIVSDLENENFECSIYGDVSSISNDLGKQVNPSDSLRVANDIRTYLNESDHTIRLPLDVCPDFVSIDCDMTFDSDLYTIHDIILDHSEKSHWLFWNEIEPGRIRISMFAVDYIQAQNNALVFDYEQKFVLDQPLSLTLNSFVINGSYTFNNIDVTSVREGSKIPFEIEFIRNYPNPFNPVTHIHYSLRESATIRLTVYDVQGKEIAILAKGAQSEGIYTVTWNGKDAQNQDAASGIYLYSLTCRRMSDHQTRVFTQKMMLMR